MSHWQLSGWKMEVITLVEINEVWNFFGRQKAGHNEMFADYNKIQYKTILLVLFTQLK